MVGARSDGPQGAVAAYPPEDLGPATTQVQQPSHHVQLGVVGVLWGGSFCPRTLQAPRPVFEVDRPAIVGVGQIVPVQLGALVHVRNPGRGEGEGLHDQGVLAARGADLAREAVQILQERAFTQSAFHQPANRGLVVGVGLGPGGMDLRLLDRLLHVLVQAFDVDGPGPGQGLKEIPERASIQVRVDVGPEHLGPRVDPRRPGLGHLGQDSEPRPHVLAALGVVGRGVGHPRRRPNLGPLHAKVEEIRRDAEAGRVVAYLVEADEAGVDVEAGVLLPLRHHRRAQLLKASPDLVGVRALDLVAQDGAQESGEVRRQRLLRLRRGQGPLELGDVEGAR